jgi:hypothetical protein
VLVSGTESVELTSVPICFTPEHLCVCSGWVVRVNVSTEVDQMMSHALDTTRFELTTPSSNSLPRFRIKPTLFKHASFHRRPFNCQGVCVTST